MSSNNPHCLWYLQGATAWGCYWDICIQHVRLFLSSENDGTRWKKSGQSCQSEEAFFQPSFFSFKLIHDRRHILTKHQCLLGIFFHVLHIVWLKNQAVKQWNFHKINEDSPGWMAWHLPPVLQHLQEKGLWGKLQAHLELHHLHHHAFSS